MARTWSVPQRGSIATISGLGSQQNGPLWELAAGHGVGYRGLFLVLAAILTTAGAVIPNLDTETLSSIFFVAGAGLAMMVVIMPWQSLVRPDASAIGGRHQSDIHPVFNSETARQVRFPELLTLGSAQSGLDRAAWAKLTAHMSHELRTPLNAVLGFSEMMTSEVFGPLGSSYSAYARDIHASGRILLKSTEDALAITALLTAPERKRTRETSRIKSVIDEACAFAAPDLAAQSIAVTIDVGSDVEIVGDHQATRQMLINLIAESTRYAAAGAALRIETKGTCESVNLSLTLLADSTGARREDGFGMILARTFCELSGAELTSDTNSSGEWTATVRLQRAAQADLFAAA